MPINPIPINERNIPAIKVGNVVKKDEKKMMDFLISDSIYTFDDVILEQKVINEIEDAMSIFIYKEKIFEDWGFSRVIKKPTNLCINLYGEPGTGKTMAANAIANRLNLRLLKVNYSDIESKYVGETSKNLVNLFNTAKENNALLLFDEADALLSKRVTDMSSATDVSVNQTRSVLLTLLDDFQGVVIFTTNFISNYDAAFMRRIPYHIKFNLPSRELREKILMHYLVHTVPNNVDISSVALRFTEISGSDIANAVLSSALKTARKKSERLEQEDLEIAIEQIIESKRQNRGHNISVEEREVSEEYAFSQIKKNGGINI
jgi:ATP-dependent 26S proteasome regulatory subunit